MDKESGEYILHWSSSHTRNDYGFKGIFYTRTRDFKEFTKPELLYEKEDSGVIDSALYEEDGRYYIFLKSEKDPAKIIMVVSDSVTGPYSRVEAFDESMKDVESGLYEAATAVRLEDGRWCLFLDYYGVPGEGQGYVPFVADSLASGSFRRADEEFSFPYGFKHGTILPITMEEYERIKAHDFADHGWQ